MRTVATIALALLLTTGQARATSNFPAAIQTDLALASPPACSLCHTTGNAGGRGTVNTPFGISMRADGLVAYDTTSLKTALDAMAAAGTDSDGDCTPDITDLKNGQDPNVPHTGKVCGTPVTQGDVPLYGCGAHVARGSADSSLPTLSTLTAFLALFARRR